MSVKYSIPVEQQDVNTVYRIFEHNNDSSMFQIAKCNNKNYAIIISNLLNDQSINTEYLDDEFNIFENVITYTVNSVRTYYQNEAHCISKYMILEHSSDDTRPKLIAESQYLAYARIITESLNKKLSCENKNVNKESI